MTDATMQNYNLAFSGGTQKLRYRSSFGYMHHLGILRGSDYERLSGRINLDTEVTKWLTMSSNVGVVYESNVIFRKTMRIQLRYLIQLLPTRSLLYTGAIWLIFPISFKHVLWVVTNQPTPGRNIRE